LVFEVGIGTSQNWNPEEAGKEVITQALSKLSKPPTFVLLFSTIHHEKNNGFKKILDAVYTQIPKETPLVGGTVAGFLENSGVYTQGLTAMCVFSDEVEIATSFGINTKKSPESASKQFAKAFQEKESKLKENIIINLTSGPTKPNFPIIGKTWVIRSGLLGKFSIILMDISTKLFQLGYGREEEVLRKISHFFPEYYILGGSSSDDNKVMRNYNFYSEQVLPNSITGIRLSTDLNVEIFNINGLVSTKVKLCATKLVSSGRVVSELNNKPASPTFVKSIGLRDADLDERLHRKTWFYPLAYKNEEGEICPAAIGAFLHNSFAFSYGIENKDLELMLFAGQKMVSETETILEKIKQKNPKFILGISCCSWVETLGRNLYIIQKKVKEAFNEKPFLIIYTLGEEIKEKGKQPRHLNESFNFLTLS